MLNDIVDCIIGNGDQYGVYIRRYLARIRGQERILMFEAFVSFVILRLAWRLARKPKASSRSAD